MGGVTLRELLAASFLVVASFTLTILSTTIVKNSNAWPLLPLMFYIFTPIPLFLCTTRRDTGGDFGFGGGESSGSTWLEAIGHFLAGGFAAAGPSMALVQYHTGATTLVTMFMSLGSGLLLGGAVVMIHLASQPQQDSS